MQVKLKQNNHIKRLKEKVANFDQLLRHIREWVPQERVKIEFMDQDKEFSLVRDQEDFLNAEDYYRQQKLEFLQFKLSVSSDKEDPEFIDVQVDGGVKEMIQHIEQMPMSNSVVIEDQPQPSKPSLTSTPMLRSGLLSDIPCYKCDGTGQSKQSICKKCQGFKMLKNSKKLQAIDYVIQKRLEQIFKGVGVEGEGEFEAKKSVSHQQGQIYQLNQTTYSYDNDDNLQSKQKTTQDLLQNNRPMAFLDRDTFKESITIDYHHDDKKHYLMKIVEQPQEAITVKNDQEFCHFTVRIMNNGSTKWPECLELVCVGGLGAGQKEGVPSLEPQQDHLMNIYINSPRALEHYHTLWSLQYGHANHIFEFGEVIQVSFIVQDNNEDFNKLMTESGISLQATDKTKMLVDIYRDAKNIPKEQIIDMIKQHGEDKPIEELMALFNSVVVQQERKHVVQQERKHKLQKQKSMTLGQL